MCKQILRNNEEDISYIVLGLLSKDLGKNAEGSVLREATPHHILACYKTGQDMVKDDTGYLFQKVAAKTYITKNALTRLKVNCLCSPI